MDKTDKVDLQVVEGSKSKIEVITIGSYGLTQEVFKQIVDKHIPAIDAPAPAVDKKMRALMEKTLETTPVNSSPKTPPMTWSFSTVDTMVFDFNPQDEHTKMVSKKEKEDLKRTDTPHPKKNKKLEPEQEPNNPHPVAESSQQDESKLQRTDTPRPGKSVMQMRGWQ